MNIKQFIGLLLIVFGVSAIIASFAFSVYTEPISPLFPSFGYYYPYENDVLPSAIIGIVLLIVGIIVIVAKVEIQGKTPSKGD